VTGRPRGLTSERVPPSERRLTSWRRGMACRTWGLEGFTPLLGLGSGRPQYCYFAARPYLRDHHRRRFDDAGRFASCQATTFSHGTG
jgi:hypothetical protein